MNFATDINPCEPTAKIKIWKREMPEFGGRIEHKYMFGSHYYPNKIIGYTNSTSFRELKEYSDVIFFKT